MWPYYIISKEVYSQFFYDALKLFSFRILGSHFSDSIQKKYFKIFVKYYIEFTFLKIYLILTSMVDLWKLKSDSEGTCIDYSTLLGRWNSEHSSWKLCVCFRKWIIEGPVMSGSQVPKNSLYWKVLFLSLYIVFILNTFQISPITCD